MSRSPPAALMARAMPKSATTACPLVQQDVLRLDVAMNDALAVGVAQRIRDLPCDAQCVIQRELLLAGDPVAQRLAPRRRA